MMWSLLYAPVLLITVFD